ncbi:hypothetical protein [Sphingomonas sp.]
MALSHPVTAQEKSEEPQNETLRKAGDIATQPARDVGAVKREVPSVLLAAAESPYASDDLANCAAIAGNIAALNAVLGDDYDVPRAEDKQDAGKMAEAGGKFVVNTILPFRGLVREVSGAAAADRRLEAAQDAGIARRGFLRGLQVARKCRRTD